MFRKTRLALVVGCFTSGFTVLALAQDTPSSSQGETLVVTSQTQRGATKLETPDIETPQAVSIITRDQIQEQGAWMLAVVLFFAATLLYSQAATAKALMPAALLLGVSPVTAVASFAAVSALFVLPTYPTLLAAVEMDDTGSTRIGKFVFNHSFLIPGVMAITLSVIFGFILGSILI